MKGRSMESLIFLDTETVGLTGPIVLIQTGEIRNGELVIRRHNVWKHSVLDTMELIERLMTKVLVIYNASFDAFHLAKIYNIFLNVKDKELPPDPHEIDDLEKIHPLPIERCIKPIGVIDLLSRLQTIDLQDIVNKKPIEIRMIPKVVLPLILPRLEEFAKSLNPLLFRKYITKDHYWQVNPTANRDLVDLKLQFKSSLKLKHVCEHLFRDDIKTIDIPFYHMPEDEKGKEYRPFNFTWIKHINYHINYWETKGIPYAEDDIKKLEKLYKYCYEPKPDLNSILAWMVGISRFRGYAIDMPKHSELIRKIRNVKDKVPTAPTEARKYIQANCDPSIAPFIKNTKKSTLEWLSKEGITAAQDVIDQRAFDKQVQLLEKFYETERFHPDLNVVGTLSNRMSGRGGLNAQGINRDKDIRSIFSLTDNGYTLSGGDFAGQEVTILEAICNDKALRGDILSGTKIHTLMAMEVYNKPKEEITEEEYTLAKFGVFSLVFGAEVEKFAQTVKVSIEKAQIGLNKFFDKYPGVRKFMESIHDDFCSMTQPHGIGTKVIWKNPKEEIESLLGFKRSFRLENTITKFMFELAEEIFGTKDFPIIGSVIRKREKPQTIKGATSSALFACAFNMQAKNLRMARNTKIQATGAGITKILQGAIWNIQPTGVHVWKVQPLNIHDEVLCPNNCPAEVAATVEGTVEALKDKVPLLKIEWKRSVKNWAELKE